MPLDIEPARGERRGNKSKNREGSAPRKPLKQEGPPGQKEGVPPMGVIDNKGKSDEKAIPRTMPTCEHGVYKSWHPQENEADLLEFR